MASNNNVDNNSNSDIDNLASAMLSLALSNGSITLSQKGAPLLYVNGFCFRLNSQTKTGKVNWRCSKYDSLKCKAKSYTYGCTVAEKYDVHFNDLESNKHNHAPDPILIDKLEHRRLIKDKAQHSEAPPRKIISNFIGSTAEVIANAPSYDADRQVIHRIKKKFGPTYPTAPIKLSDIELPDFLKYTIERKREEDQSVQSVQLFLLYDSGPEDEDRFFIFATDENIANLSENHLYCDGTFDIAPNLFLQVYSIHALLQGRCLPLVYAILPRKTQGIYVKFLTVIKEKMGNRAPPKSITSDYEKAFLNACDQVFMDVILYGCFFHFKQSMWRRITELHIHIIVTTITYNSDSNYRKLLKLPQALAFVPIDDVVELFGELKKKLNQENEVDQKILEFYNYMEKNYVGRDELVKTGRRYVKITTVHHAPLFAIELWNVHARVADGVSRTNNFVEAWHCAFSNMLPYHPLIYSLVDHFRKEQGKVEENIIRLKTGIVYKRKPEYIILDERLQEIVKNYNKNKYEDFFESIALILKY